jgi:hypothetical protein
MQFGLALMIREIHDGDQPLGRGLLPAESDKAVVSPVAVPGGAAVEELPVSFAHGGVAQHGEQAGVELRQDCVPLRAKLCRGGCFLLAGNEDEQPMERFMDQFWLVFVRPA